ncbi:hypothetical protein MMC30_005434 [Trapelia coarctata]|nr:hypothetical protein [Trapelia coarctata]
MPFREKMKKAFGRSPSGASSSTLTTVLSTTSSTKKSKKGKKQEESYENWPENVYKPHEMPRPKYRGIVDKKHKDRLEAFSFGSALEAMRRRSGQSQYSPMGSRLPSRGPSHSSQRRRATSPYYMGGEGLAEDKDAGDDVGNVGLSRRQTREDTAAAREGEGLEASKTITPGLSRTVTNGNGLEASRTITNGQVNGRGNGQVNGQTNSQLDGHGDGHGNGQTNGFREVAWADDVSAALARTSIR